MAARDEPLRRLGPSAAQVVAAELERVKDEWAGDPRAEFFQALAEHMSVAATKFVETLTPLMQRRLGERDVIVRVVGALETAVDDMTQAYCHELLAFFESGAIDGKIEVELFEYMLAGEL